MARSRKSNEALRGSKKTSKRRKSTAGRRVSIPPIARPAKAAANRTPKSPRAKQPRKNRSAERQLQTDAERLKVRQTLELYTPLVYQIAGGFQRKLPRNVLREDLLAAGMSGLWDAIRRHGERDHESFEWYVRVRIRGAILDELRAQDWLPRRARAAAAQAEPGQARLRAPAIVRFDDVSEWEQSRCLASGDASNSEISVDAKFVRENLNRAVEQLPDRERHIVAAHYFRGVKFKDLGAELGVSEPRISQLHSRAMQRLKNLMASAA